MSCKFSGIVVASRRVLAGAALSLIFALAPFASAAAQSLTNTATVTAAATVTDGTPGNNTASATVDVTAAATTTVTKIANPATGSNVSPGDTIEYTLTVTVANAATNQVLSLADTLGAGLTFGAVTDTGAFLCTGSLDCTLPAGTPVGSHALTYTAVVDNDATGTVGNSVVASNPAGGDPDPVCTTCTTEHQIVVATTTVTKSANPVTGSTVMPGDTIEYTLTVDVANAATTQVLSLSDTLGAGLTFGAVTDTGAFLCTGALDCTLPVGTTVGSHAITYTAVVDSDAAGTVGNTVVASNPTGGDPDPVCVACTTEHEIVAATTTVTKSANPATGSTVLPGDTIEYTLTVDIADSATTQVLSLSDTLGAGLTFGAVTNTGAFVCTGNLSCTLPAGTTVGSYALTYTAAVDSDATGTVGNSVVASNPPDGDFDPVCAACTTEHEIAPATTTVTKSANPATGSTVLPGDTIEYTVTVDVANSATTQVLSLSDTLGAGLTFGAVTDTGAFVCTGSLDCTLPAGTTVGSHALTYTAVVDSDATGTVGNSVVASNPTGGDPDPVCAACTTEHQIVPAELTVTKSANPATGSTVLPGDTIEYTLTVDVANSATTQALSLSDTLGAGLTFGAVTDAGTFVCTGSLDCTLPVGATVGSHTLTYTAMVDTDATGTVGNSVVASNPPGGDLDPVCAACTTEHQIVPAEIVVSKAANPAAGSTVLPGDTIEYTLTVMVANSNTSQDVVLVDTLGPGLTFGEVTDAGGFLCTGTLSCTLPANSTAGSHAVTYTAVVDTDATGTVGNSVVASNPPGGDPDPVCATCVTEHQIAPAETTVTKTANPTAGSTLLPGDTIEYTLTVEVANSTTTQPLSLVDTLGAGLTFGAVTDTGAFLCTGALDCTLPAGATVGSHALTYTAVIDTDATGTVDNSVVASNPPGGDPDPVCASCTTEHKIVLAETTVTKTANPAAGSTLLPGDTIEYTLTVEVANSSTTQPLSLADTLGAGLTFGAVTDTGAFLCTGGLDCTLPAGATVGSHTLTYTAEVDADATGTVDNSVVASNPPGGDPDPVCASCTTEHKIVLAETTVTKTANPAAGSTVLPGDTIEYTLAVDVANSITTQPLSLVDTLGAGLTFGAVTDAGGFDCTGVLTCTLPAGAAVGSHTLTYTAKVDPDATGTVGNSVVATNPAGGDPDPVCTTCTTEHKIHSVAITVAKSADRAAGTEVRVGDTIAYTVAVTVASSVTTEQLDLTDTLSPGLSFGELTDTGKFTCTGTLSCVLPAGTLPGLYEVAYTATVDADASKQVSNQVTATGGGGSTPDCSSCSIEHLLADPKITISKSSNPVSGTQVRIGDTIEYTLTARVENSATLDDVYLADVPGLGLDVASLPAGCSKSGDGFRCALAAGTVPGIATFSYQATVTADAGDNVVNLVAGESAGKQPECDVCETTHKVLDETSLRISKVVSSRTARIGDLLRYTLTIENVGARNFVGGTTLDTPPAGFSYVEGSMSVADGDGAFNLSPGQSPLRIGGLDIPVGEKATVVYLLRVNAGVRPGTYINEAVALGSQDDPVSNVATAQVLVESDPLLDDSLIFGTVFDDRDGDGWQDSALLDGVRVQGGFDPAAYIPGTTTIDRGQGPVPQADASAPLLHGIDVGRIDGRGSIADPGAARQIVIRQHLREPAFNDDFVLTSDQGLSLRMDAAGDTSIERKGDAASSIGAGEPAVERRVARIDGGYEVAYVIGNAGIDERGIPGVRLASVEGLLIETDQYGRYHLVDVQGGDNAHGRNFILKVDPATLPPQTEFTTDNPLVRRITPGVPVRFSFGVKLPVQEIPGATRQLELQLGEVIFAPDSAQIRTEYMPAIVKMAEQVNAHDGGEVVITANGGNEALAFARAEAVRNALVAKASPDATKALKVSLRTRVDDPHSLVAMLGGSETLLGTVLFDTDRSTIRPEFNALLDRVAERLDEMKGGTVGIVGHTDVRGSHAYNTALGLRRAQAVFDALAERLSLEARATLRVESSNDPKAPLGTAQK